MPNQLKFVKRYEQIDVEIDDEDLRKSYWDDMTAIDGSIRMDVTAAMGLLKTTRAYYNYQNQSNL